MKSNCYLTAGRTFGSLVTILIAGNVAASAVNAKTLPEYSAAEAKKHIGETAKVTGKVECAEAYRSGHMLWLGACPPNAVFRVVVPNDASGPDLNTHELKGVIVTVSEKIEKGSDGMPEIIVQSTAQIVPHTKLKPD